jgi:hypothetical protein
MGHYALLPQIFSLANKITQKTTGKSARGKEEVYYANQIDLCLSLDLAWESYSKQ